MPAFCNAWVWVDGCGFIEYKYMWLILVSLCVWYFYKHMHAGVCAFTCMPVCVCFLPSLCWLLTQVNNAGCMVHERQHQEDGLEVNFATNTLGAADSTFPSEERAHISVMWSRHMSCAVLFQEHTFSRPSWFLFWKRANLHVWWELDMAMRGGEGKERGERGEGRENGGEGRRGEGGEEGRGRRMGGSSVRLPLQFPLF